MAVMQALRVAGFLYAVMATSIKQPESNAKAIPIAQLLRGAVHVNALNGCHICLGPAHGTWRGWPSGFLDAVSASWTGRSTTAGYGCTCCRSSATCRRRGSRAALGGHVPQAPHRSRAHLRVALDPPRYAVVKALFRDAELGDLVEQSPCVLDEHQLGRWPTRTRVARRGRVHAGPRWSRSSRTRGSLRVAREALARGRPAGARLASPAALRHAGDVHHAPDRRWRRRGHHRTPSRSHPEVPQRVRGLRRGLH